MVCEDCTGKPSVRGIKFIKCIKCGKDCHIMYGDFDVCEECSDEFGICKVLDCELSDLLEYQADEQK